MQTTFKLFFSFFLCCLTLSFGGCGSAKPNRDVIDTSLVLDRTFEDQKYGFRFNYPSSLPFEGKSSLKEDDEVTVRGVLEQGSATLWFTPEQKLASNAVMMTVQWVMKDRSKQTKSEHEQTTKRAGGSLQFFEKIKLAGKDCTYVRSSGGGMMMGDKRIAEGYFLTLKDGTGIGISFFGPSDKIETYRPQFNAVLKSFKFDTETGETAELPSGEE